MRFDPTNGRSWRSPCRARNAPCGNSPTSATRSSGRASSRWAASAGVQLTGTATREIHVEVDPRGASQPRAHLRTSSPPHLRARTRKSPRPHPQGDAERSVRITRGGSSTHGALPTSSSAVRTGRPSAFATSPRARHNRRAPLRLAPRQRADADARGPQDLRRNTVRSRDNIKASSATLERTLPRHVSLAPHARRLAPHREARTERAAHHRAGRVPSPSASSTCF